MQSYPTAGLLHRQHFSKSRRVLSALNVQLEIVSTNSNNLPYFPPIESTSQNNSSHEKISKLASPLRKMLAVFSILFVIFSFSLAGILVLPNVYYQVFPTDALPIVPTEIGTPLGGSFNNSQKRNHYQPAFDSSLPEGNWIYIPRIGVRTELLNTENADDALNKGVWWVPNFGVPGDFELPMILAAHRYGWKWWWNTIADPNDPQSIYALRNSFYNLPITEPGDQVEIISGQRKYVYEIYGGEESDEITDYDADLILYTCKFINSPIRHIRYARLIDPEKNTQR